MKVIKSLFILNCKIIQKNCPICGNKLINNSINRVYNKSDFPKYAIIPINLVPICNDCNFAKRDNESKENIIFNSYLDSINKDEIKLQDDFKEEVYIKVDWDNIKNERLKKY
ncbi:hypothetical protein CBF86_06010 [Limosilactobacillus reuteri]|uniref:hypothetical protein n=1 Tax=Limosilactobacillus reuteri TaxID=1598 RepID=UPI000B987846|nr:hypothetical protein [Limosilactobacillus reuteri]OYS47835.1 hypothetical protein CBF86_06010 [Limosilactobacillus reuteri]